MRVFMNRKTVHKAWGGGNMFVKAFYEHAPAHGIEVVLDPNHADVILVIGFDGGNTGISFLDAWHYRNKGKRVVARINENDARKGTTGVDTTIAQIVAFSDGVVFVSHWLKQYFAVQPWTKMQLASSKFHSSAVITNGVDERVFKYRPKEDTNTTNIVAHHWSDNRLKGADIYEELDKFVAEHGDFKFTYVGRHQCSFEHTNVVQPLYGNALGEELAKHDVYVSASRFDPGPNHILEAIASRLPTYVHADGGGCVEFAGQDHVYETWHELKAVLLSKKYTQNSQKPRTWEQCIAQYAGYIKQL